MSDNSSFNSSLHPTLDENSNSGVCISMSTALSITYILLLPLFIFILYVGYDRWRKQRSVAVSHSDVFTFNMVFLELISILGYCFFCYGSYTNQENVMTVGIYIFSIVSAGQTLFHLLTCVERYLAVIHPVTYLGLRQAGGVRIRNISIGCVWLFCLGLLGLAKLRLSFYRICSLSLLLLSCVVVSFCSVSVLCVLIRPGPGEVGGIRERVDQSKQRAFNTIMVIMGALLLRFLCSLVSAMIYADLVFIQNCLVARSMSWFSLPSSLVLPMLFLHRAGKLPGCNQNTVST